MPLTVSFTISESIAYPGRLTFTDTSTGSDGAITNRIIYIQLPDGTYLVPEGTTTDYIVWDYADASITFDVLERSQAANVTVKWLAGSTISYTDVVPYCFPFYDYVFAFNKIRPLTSMPNLIDNKNYYETSIKFITNLWNAEIAAEIGEDITASQNCLDRNYFIIQNPQLYR